MKKRSKTNDSPGTQAADDLEATAASAGRYARKLLDESSLVEGVEGLTATISEKPIQSVAIAFGIGMLLAAIIRR